LTYFKTSFSSLSNQRHVTFQPSLYAYGCVCICKWDVYETGQIFSRKFEFYYFRKTTQPFLMCFKEIILRLQLKYIVTACTLKQYIW